MIKAALVLQGGGVRGAYTSGVLDKLMEENIELEAIYAVSAGAKNSQYYVSKQIGEAIKVDLFCINNRKAISFHNLIFEGGMISADYYQNFIMKKFAPTNEEFERSPQKFFATATNCLTGEATYFEKSSCNILDAITASCSIPLIQKMKYIDNIPYLDGGISNNVPINKAIEDGYDKIVVVLTRPKGYRESPNSKLNKLYKIKYHNYPNLLNKLITQTERYNETLDKIDELENNGKILVIYPSSNIPLSMLERDEEKILNLYEMGKSDLVNKLDQLRKYLNN